MHRAKDIQSSNLFHSININTNCQADQIFTYSYHSGPSVLPKLKTTSATNPNPLINHTFRHCHKNLGLLPNPTPHSFDFISSTTFCCNLQSILCNNLRSQFKAANYLHARSQEPGSRLPASSPIKSFQTTSICKCQTTRTTASKNNFLHYSDCWPSAGGKAGAQSVGSFGAFSVFQLICWWRHATWWSTSRTHSADSETWPKSWGKRCQLLSARWNGAHRTRNGNGLESRARKWNAAI